MVQASQAHIPDKMITPMAPAVGADAEAAAQSAQVLHPGQSAPRIEEKSFARTRGMRWYMYLLWAGVLIVGVGLLIGIGS